MIKFICAFFVLLQGFSSFSQGFGQLGSAEKIWVFIHPFSANKAKKISNSVIELTDSVAKTKDWLSTNSGGRKDVFRHGLWMAMMSSRIGPKRALWLGRAHEKKNIKDFKKKRLEEGQVPDQKSIEMDLFNNEIGVKLGLLDDISTNALMIEILESIENGNFKMIKMDKNGNSIDALGSIIPINLWRGKWVNERELISSF